MSYPWVPVNLDGPQGSAILAEMIPRTQRRFQMTTMTCAIALALTTLASMASAEDIRYRSFSASAAIGPPAEHFAGELDRVTGTALGDAGRVHFVALPGIPAIPAQFGGDIVTAVAAGERGGGFDAAYISGSDLNKTWGFLFNSGFPMGPSFDEFAGFLFGPVNPGKANDGKTVLDLMQEIERKRNVVAIPIVGSPEQLSGYFLDPIGPTSRSPGIGLSGLCEQRWTLRYLTPGEDVLRVACDDLVHDHRARANNLTFIKAVPGGGSLVDAVAAGTIQGFEFATPLDDVSQLFGGTQTPATLGVRYVHVPGWQQQFLLTWMLVNQARWNTLSAARQAIVMTTAKNHVLTSYADNLRRQGPALATILADDGEFKRREDGMVLVRWPTRDLRRLSTATIKFLDQRSADSSLPASDRADYARFLSLLRTYVRDNDHYWRERQVDPKLRFPRWTDADERTIN